MARAVNNSLAIAFPFALSVIKLGSLPASVCKTVVAHKLSGSLLACSSRNSSGDDGNCALFFLTGGYNIDSSSSPSR